MKIEKYEESNGYVNVILTNVEEEQLCLCNPNIYNHGKWEIQSYVKRKYGDDIFDVITVYDGKKSYMIQYSSQYFSRIIECNSENIVLAEAIRTKQDDTFYYPNPSILGVKCTNEYIKQDITYHDVNGNKFDGDINESREALLKYLEYTKKYTEILSGMEPFFKTNLEEIGIEQSSFNSLKKKI